MIQLTSRRLLLLGAIALVPALMGTSRAQQTGPQPELPKQPLTIVTHDGKRHLFQVEMAIAPEQQCSVPPSRPMAVCCSIGAPNARRRCG